MFVDFTRGIRYYLTQLMDHVAIKAIISSFVALFGFIYPEGAGTTILIILVLIFVDTITGVMASVREGKAITSGRLRDTVFKGFLYIMIITCIYLTDTVLNLPFDVQLAYIFNAYLAVNELWSITENAERLNLPVPNKIKKILQGQINKYNQ